MVEQVTMEVWEVEETRQSKVFSTVLERPVTHCCVLETSKVIATFQGAPSAFLHLDLLLVIIFFNTKNTDQCRDSRS